VAFDKYYDVYIFELLNKSVAKCNYNCAF